MASTTGEAERQFQCKSEKCGSFNYEQTNEGIFCGDCGEVIEDSAFDLSVSFTENQDGSRSMNGKFVSNLCTTPYRFGPGGVPFSRESREVTIANGKKKIQQLASALKISGYVEAAHRLFLSAVQLNFVHGRKTSNVVAACLYIVCRQRKSSHLLIDFSDLLQTNVYVLGNCFLKFRRLLKLQLPAVDPVHYIDRFAAQLEFGDRDKTREVAKTAHKLVARMKRDWIQTGRRPSGVCGAALIMASRLHGYHRTQREVVHVMKICEETLRQRLVEFEATPSGSLTVEEFLQIDLPEEADPPSFTRNRKKERDEEERKELQRLLENGETPPPQPEPDTQTTQQVATAKRHAKTKETYDELEKEIEEFLDEEKGLEKSLNEEKEREREQELAGETEKKKQQEGETKETVDETKEETDDEDADDVDAIEPKQAAKGQQNMPPPLPPTVPKPPAALTSMKLIRTEQEVTSGQSREVCTYDDVHDDELFKDEIDDMILEPSESQMKKCLWQLQNKEYLEKERQDRAEGKVKRKRKRKSRAEREAEQAGSAAEATEKLIEQNTKKMSKKVNYTKWNALFTL